MKQVLPRTSCPFALALSVPLFLPVSVFSHDGKAVFSLTDGLPLIASPADNTIFVAMPAVNPGGLPGNRTGRREIASVHQDRIRIQSNIHQNKTL
jgi:hypothetical protein